MKATELRIGNLISFEKEYYTISGISQAFTDEPFDVELKNDNGMFESIDIEEVSPIPLTEEWLLKFGFEKAYSCYHKQTKIGKEIILNKNYFLMDIDFPVCVDEVHKLQNLFFALTGEELQIKP